MDLTDISSSFFNFLNPVDNEIHYAPFGGGAPTHIPGSPGIRIIHSEYSSENTAFNPGQPRDRNRIRTRRIIRPSSLACNSFYPPPWHTRITAPPEQSFIRLLDPPSGDIDLYFLWMKDHTLTDWIDIIAEHERNQRDPNHMERLRAIFATNQRKRWLARLTLQRWTQRVWRKRTQCNVDMIDMATFPDSDAIYLTDTKHHQIFRFHRRDIFTNLLSNICMSDEMLPCPRYPTNPWTNEKLTQSQTIGLCMQLVADYGCRGACPPVLFAAFWAARFSLKRFHTENSAILAQHAISAYFKDLHDDNHGTVYDTITTLLSNAGLQYSSTSIRRWLRDSPQTAIHKEWLTLVRDYTLYINLHVQARPNWHGRDRIYADVRRLYDRTVFPENQRLQILRANNLLPNPLLANQPPLGIGLLGLPSLLHNYQFDLSGGLITQNAALQLIQDALFRL